MVRLVTLAGSLLVLAAAEDDEDVSWGAFSGKENETDLGDLGLAAKGVAAGSATS